jgi:hypothetical protein
MENVYRTNISGHNGGNVISTTAATPAPEGREFVEIRVITTTVIATLVGTLTNVAGLTGISLAAGLVITGRFTSITLTSGVVEALLD